MKAEKGKGGELIGFQVTLLTPTHSVSVPVCLCVSVQFFTLDPSVVDTNVFLTGLNFLERLLTASNELPFLVWRDAPSVPTTPC